MNILIVDDEKDSLNEIEDYVKSYGGFDACVVCSNAIEALDQAAKISIDIALMDIEMPAMNGLELAERLTNIFPHIGIAFLTAYNHYAAEAFEVNAIDYILKPIRKERLFKALDKLKAKRPGAKAEESRVSISMFGKFTVRMDNELIKWNRQKSSELFAYLLENKEYPVRKEMLCELLWPDLEPKKALTNLQTAMYSIRKTLAINDSREVLIEYSGNSYTLHINDIFTDVDKFEYLLQKATKFNDLDYLKQAVSLYTGNYLEDEGWLWAEPKKVMLRRKYLDALKRLKANRGFKMK